MSDETKPTESEQPMPDAAAPEGPANPSEPAEPAEAVAAEAEIAAEEEAVAVLQAEVADLKDKLLRAVAETENIRRRAARINPRTPAINMPGPSCMSTVPPSTPRIISSKGSQK